MRTTHWVRRRGALLMTVGTLTLAGAARCHGRNSTQPAPSVSGSPPGAADAGMPEFAIHWTATLPAQAIGDDPLAMPLLPERRGIDARQCGESQMEIAVMGHGLEQKDYQRLVTCPWTSCAVRRFHPGSAPTGA